MTRPYNTTPMLEDDGPDLIECPECDEGMVIHGAVGVPCSRCNGTGTIDRHDDDGSDAFDAACDDAYERQIDREAGLL